MPAVTFSVDRGCRLMEGQLILEIGIGLRLGESAQPAF